MKNPAPRKTNSSTADDSRLKAAPTADKGAKPARRAATKTASQGSAPPATTREEEIQKRAYSLWEGEGRPEHRHKDHWRMAEHELDAQQGEDDNPTNLAALREASREHTDAFLVKTDLEDADQREVPGTREQD